MTKLLNERESKFEKIWVLGFRLVGVVMFLVAIYLPVKSLLIEGAEEIDMTRLRIGFAVAGFFLVWGGKSFGILANNIGAAFNSFLNKWTK